MGGGVGAGVWGGEAEGRVGGHLDDEGSAGLFQVLMLLSLEMR